MSVSTIAFPCQWSRHACQGDAGRFVPFDHYSPLRSDHASCVAGSVDEYVMNRIVFE